MALYRGGPEPRPSPPDLVQLAAGMYRDLGQLVGTDSGRGAFGAFGTALFRSHRVPRAQVWCLSNGCDFIFATHIFEKEPDRSEVLEAQEIVTTATLRAEG